MTDSHFVVRIALVVVASMGLAAFVVGCGGSSGSSVVAMTLADLQGDPTVHLAIGQTLDLALDENPSTGFTWHCTWVPQSGLQLVANSYTSSLPSLPGSGGTRHFRLKGQRGATAVVTIQSGRWWDGGELMDPISFTVVVGGWNGPASP
jgi:predicted secreted protein